MEIGLWEKTSSWLSLFCDGVNAALAGVGLTLYFRLLPPHGPGDGGAGPGSHSDLDWPGGPAVPGASDGFLLGGAMRPNSWGRRHAGSCLPEAILTLDLAEPEGAG